MSSSNCCFLTCTQISQEAGQVVWYSHLFQNFPQVIVIHTVKGFGIVNMAEIDVFLELSCFFHDPVDIGNLISGSSAFSKSSLNIRKSRFTYCWYYKYVCGYVCVCVCIYIYIERERERDNWIIVVQQKLTQHCKSTILQLNKFFKKAMQWLPWLSGHQVQWQEQLQSAEYRPCFFLPPTTGGREQLKMKRTRGGCSELSSEDSGPCEGKRQLHLWGSYKMFTNVVLV